MVFDNKDSSTKSFEEKKQLHDMEGFYSRPMEQILEDWSHSLSFFNLLLLLFTF